MELSVAHVCAVTVEIADACRSNTTAFTRGRARAHAAKTFDVTFIVARNEVMRLSKTL